MGDKSNGFGLTYQTMYNAHFQLEKMPFEQTPDSEFLYLSEQHGYALASMKFAIAKRDAFVIVTGEIGSGKTTLLNKVLKELADDIVVARVSNTQLTDTEILQAILAEFGFTPFKKHKAELIFDLRKFIEAQNTEGRQVALMIDEAQNLSRNVLEELRMLTGIETEKEKIVTILLLGQPELSRKIDDPTMDQLRQRARLRLNIGALSKDETQAYILHRLNVAGCKQNELFDKKSLSMIYEACGGVPRLINTLCDTALTACMLAEEKKVTSDTVEKVLDELGWSHISHVDKLSTTATHQALVVLQLEIEDDGQPVATHVVTESGCVIGRASDCGITVDSKYLSQHHAMFSREGALWQISDLNSTNGTYLNSSRIRTSLLEDYDVIDLGTCRIRVSLVAGENLEQTASHANEEILKKSKRKNRVKDSKKAGKIRVVK